MAVGIWGVEVILWDNAGIAKLVYIAGFKMKKDYKKLYEFLSGTEPSQGLMGFTVNILYLCHFNRISLL